jgi:pyruvate dehydrogenase E2 component (dihydrolipoamide acetyltransferase)
MAQEIKLPSLGGDSAEGTLLNWLKQPGDSVKADDIIAEVEADKATIEVPAGVNGTVLQLVGSVGETIRVGSTIAVIGAAGEAPAPAPAAAPAAARSNGAPASAPAAGAPAPAPAAPPPVEEDVSYPDGIKASPIARRIADERGIDIRMVRGSGPGGRVTKVDVEGFVAPAVAPVPPAATPAPAIAVFAGLGQTWPDTMPSEDVEIIELTRLRGRIAQRMNLSKSQVPHFYVTVDIDSAPLVALRAEINATQPEDAKITLNDFVVKAAALTVAQFPNLNTHYYGDKLVRHKRINIGIAVAIPNGLLNVVAHDADKLALGIIAKRNKEMIARAREGKVKPEDVQGSTFTVSNLGAFDVEHFSAIINPPESGILAISSAKKVPVVLADGTLAVGNRMKATVSVDHRVSDGAEGAQFMQAFKTLIENPKRLLV